MQVRRFYLREMQHSGTSNLITSFFMMCLLKKRKERLLKDIFEIYLHPEFPTLLMAMLKKMRLSHFARDNAAMRAEEIRLFAFYCHLYTSSFGLFQYIWYWWREHVCKSANTLSEVIMLLGVEEANMLDSFIINLTIA